MNKIKCTKCGDILHASGFVRFTQCGCKSTFVDGLSVKGLYRAGGTGFQSEKLAKSK